MPASPQESWEWFSQLLEGIEPEKLNKRYRNTYGYIWGTCLALQESLVHLSTTDPKLAADRMNLLPKDNFGSYIQRDGYVRWRKDKTMRMYACEFFLNKAQNNVAACLDSISNQWLWDALPGPFQRERLYARWDFFHLFFPTRMRIIAAIRENQMYHGTTLQPSVVFDLIGDDWERFGGLMDTERASEVIQSNIERVEASVVDGTFSSIFRTAATQPTLLLHTEKKGDVDEDTPLSVTDCLSIISGRVNAYKHLPTGHNDREGNYHHTEWVMTARALLCIRELFRDKLNSVRRYETET